jgi:hypothetical protein
LRSDLIHRASAEVLEMTADEWMTVGGEIVMWVPEKIDVSDSWTV